MGFTIKVTDDEGNILTQSQSDSVALVYGSIDGIHSETFLNCCGTDALYLAIAMDDLREHILSQNKVLRILYDARDEFIDDKVEIDLGAIKRALRNRGKDND